MQDTLILHIAVISAGQMSGTTGIIRCPPYCRTNCATNHHPILVALLNTVDTADTELMDKRLQEFKDIFLRYPVRYDVFILMI